MNSSKTALVRRRKTPAQRQRLLARFHQSQLTQRDFATRHGIGLSTLGKWLRVGGKATPSPVEFQEVVLPNAPLRYAVEVVSPQGWIVRLQDSSEVHTLPQLLQGQREGESNRSSRLNKSASAQTWASVFNF
jgi:transposase-like protein